MSSEAAVPRDQNKIKLRLMKKYFIEEIALAKQHYWVIISKNIWCAGPYL